MTAVVPSRVDIAYFPLGASAFGGAERSLLELAASQQAAGKRVLVCHEAALEGTDFMAQAAALHLPLQRVGWAPGQPLMATARAAWRLFRHGVDAPLLHFNISWRAGMWLVPLVARLAGGARLVGTMRAMPEPYGQFPRRRLFGVLPAPRLWTWPDLAMGRVWARCLHATVSVNRDDYPPRLVREFAFSRRRVSVIYNGVRVPLRAPTPTEKLAAKQRLGYTAGDLLVACVGRVSAEKGLRVMVEALAGCPAHVKLVVAGDGDERASLEALATALGVAGRVNFIGYVPQPFDVFTAADVAVVPSLANEAFGRVVVEAMACAAAVVASQVGGMRELFTDGREGLFVPKGDAAALAAAVGSLAADPARLQALQRAGRALAEERYSTARVVGEYAALYRRVAG